MYKEYFGLTNETFCRRSCDGSSFMSPQQGKTRARLIDALASADTVVTVTGPAGCGKSSTLAALVNLINEQREEHILTVEDPIEVVHTSKKCLVNQRHAGHHTSSFARALRGALREDPDIIVIGELRDLETISLAMTAAETGHFVLATLHTNNAVRTISRMIGAFPSNQQPQVRTMLSESLRAVISQRLVPRADGKGRVPALEVLISTAFVRECISDKDRTKEIPEAISKGFTTYGMQSFDQSLMQLVKEGLVTYEEALKNVSNPDDFALRYRGIASTSDAAWEDFSEGQEDASDAEKPDLDELGVGDDFSIDRF